VNPLYLLRYHEEMNELAVDAQLDFGDEGGGGEIWSCSSCPLDAKLVVTCRNSNSDANDGAETETALWRIPDDAIKEDDLDFYPDEDEFGDKSQDINKSMTKIAGLDLAPATGRVTDMQWNPGCIPDSNDFDDNDTPTTGQITGANFLTVQNGNREVCVTTWDVNTSTAIKMDQTILSISNERNVMPSPPKATWDPHNQNICAVTVGTNISVLDMRTPTKVINGLKSCHRFGVTDVDYNPNKPYVLSSSGQDALVKFWDLRFTSSYDNDHHSNSASLSRHSPRRTLRGGHTHWTTSVKYNSFHDQLLLSSGTDGMVNLWRVSSISSAPLLDLGGNSAVDDMDDNDFDGDDDNPATTFDNTGMGNDEDAGDSASVETDGGNAPDVRVTKMEMREAIYDLAWSAADPWVFVTLSFDGNVVLNHVPSKEKYKILL